MNFRVLLRATLTLTNSLSNLQALYSMFLLAVAIISACNHVAEPQRNITEKDVREPLIKANIAANQLEEQDINDLIERYGWKMTKTGSGLHYWVYNHGSGTKAEPGKVAIISYTLRSIAGDIIYTSSESGPMEFLLGKGIVAAGLEEAILLMRVGDKAKIIIPSHLGFGLAGDDHKIPPKATLIYDIELLAIN